MKELKRRVADDSSDLYEEVLSHLVIKNADEGGGGRVSTRYAGAVLYVAIKLTAKEEDED